MCQNLMWEPLSFAMFLAAKHRIFESPRIWSPRGNQTWLAGKSLNSMEVYSWEKLTKKMP